MALDRQRILSELGSVMNQLKSADCGCMGKLFGSDGQASASPSPVPTCGGCRRNCCYDYGQGWNSNGSCGEPYQGNAQMPCMGRCNPPKLYADTYNYLTDNLMQPTINEVYNDLKSLTPDNTIANNPMANQMGLSPNSLAAQGNLGEMSNINAGNMGNMNASNMGNTNAGNIGNINAGNMANMNAGNMGNMNAGNMGNMNAGNMGNINARNPYNNFTGQPTNAGSMPTNDANPDEMGQMGGMGPQIMNMVGNMTNQNKTNPNAGQNGQLTGPMLIDAPQSPHGQIGITPFSAPMRTNQDAYNAQGYSSGYNANQNMTQPNIQPGGNIQNPGNTNPAAQQMAAGHRHGPHSQSIAKFNEMFPGVMGGNLDFDPMAIAIQMNPANHQQAAMKSMAKMMQNNNINQVFDPSANTASLEGKGAQQNQIQNNVPYDQVKQLNPLQQAGNETVQPNVTPTNQMAYQNAANVYRNPNEQLNNQQVYTAGSGEPVPNQQTSQPDYQHHNIIDPNTGSVMPPPTLSSATPISYEATPGQPAGNLAPQNVPRMIKEPILPADTSRYIAPRHPKYFEYNTLGQPIEKFSPEIYRTPEPTLPQTLSPQYQPKPRIDAGKYSNVKSTVSKTSLMGAKLGRTPSQLQQIYNQYKGSQSYTQQSIGAPGVNAVSHSEGQLNAPQTSHQRQIPVEKVGGDTIVNNQIRDERSVKVEQVMGQIGDVPAAVKPAAVAEAKPVEMSPVLKRNTRNGLQDMVYTSYPTSAAWSFHGVKPRPCSPSERHRYYR